MSFDLIIQARTKSKRLPNKVLLPIGNKTILDYFIQNLKKIKLIKRIILAIPNNDNLSGFEKIALNNNISIFHSKHNDENNVLKRFYDCAKKYKCINIVRITPDCPFINIFVVEKMLSLFEKNNYLLLTNNKPRKIPHGFDCEIFRFSLLKKTYLNAKKKEDLEHVTKWIYENDPDTFTNVSIFNKNFSNKRITLDYLKDYQFFVKNFELLKKISRVKNCEKLLEKI